MRIQTTINLNIIETRLIETAESPIIKKLHTCGRLITTKKGEWLLPLLQYISRRVVDKMPGTARGHLSLYRGLVGDSISVQRIGSRAAKTDAHQCIIQFGDLRSPLPSLDSSMWSKDIYKRTGRHQTSAGVCSALTHVPGESLSPLMRQRGMYTIAWHGMNGKIISHVEVIDIPRPR